jgi:hypothetical protein
MIYPFNNIQTIVTIYSYIVYPLFIVTILYLLRCKYTKLLYDYSWLLGIGYRQYYPSSSFFGETFTTRVSNSVLRLHHKSHKSQQRVFVISLHSLAGSFCVNRDISRSALQK